MKPDVVHVGEQSEQRAPESGDVGDQDRLLVAIELRPGHLLDQLLERADASRQRDEGVGALEHRLLALVHVLDHQHLLRVGERMLLAHEKTGDNSGHEAAARQRRPRHASHQALAASAVDEADPLARQNAPERVGRLAEAGIVAGARTAIDANASNGAHAGLNV